MSDARLREAYTFWVLDLDRILSHELRESLELDHFKQAGHLTYWLRRASPVINFSIAEEDPTADEVKWHKVFFAYGMQCAAFQIGFDLCRYFEANKKGSIFYTNDFDLDIDWYETVGHVLKAKNVSPHSLALMFKSIFTDPLAKVRKR